MQQQQKEYIDDILAFTQKQIYFNTGLTVKLAVDGAPTGPDQPRRILSAIEQALWLKPGSIANGNREFAWARKIAAYILKIDIDPLISYEQLASVFNKTHSSIIQSVQLCAEKLAGQDPYFTEQYKKALTAARSVLQMSAHD